MTLPARSRRRRCQLPISIAQIAVGMPAPVARKHQRAERDDVGDQDHRRQDPGDGSLVPFATLGDDSVRYPAPRCPVVCRPGGAPSRAVTASVCSFMTNLSIRSCQRRRPLSSLYDGRSITTKTAPNLRCYPGPRRPIWPRQARALRPTPATASVRTVSASARWPPRMRFPAVVIGCRISRSRRDQCSCFLPTPATASVRTGSASALSRHRTRFPSARRAFRCPRCARTSAPCPLVARR